MEYFIEAVKIQKKRDLGDLSSMFFTLWTGWKIGANYLNQDPIRIFHPALAVSLSLSHSLLAAIGVSMRLKWSSGQWSSRQKKKESNLGPDFHSRFFPPLSFLMRPAWHNVRGLIQLEEEDLRPYTHCVECAPIRICSGFTHLGRMKSKSVFRVRPSTRVFALSVRAVRSDDTLHQKATNLLARRSHSIYYSNGGKTIA